MKQFFLDMINLKNHEEHESVLVTLPCGSGKTYSSTAACVDHLLNGGEAKVICIAPRRANLIGDDIKRRLAEKGRPDLCKEVLDVPSTKESVLAAFLDPESQAEKMIPSSLRLTDEFRALKYECGEFEAFRRQAGDSREAHAALKLHTSHFAETELKFRRLVSKAIENEKNDIIHDLAKAMARETGQSEMEILASKTHRDHIDGEAQKMIERSPRWRWIPLVWPSARLDDVKCVCMTHAKFCLPIDRVWRPSIDLLVSSDFLADRTVIIDEIEDFFATLTSGMISAASKTSHDCVQLFHMCKSAVDNHDFTTGVASNCFGDHGRIQRMTHRSQTAFYEIADYYHLQSSVFLADTAYGKRGYRSFMFRGGADVTYTTESDQGSEILVSWPKDYRPGAGIKLTLTKRKIDAESSGSQNTERLLYMVARIRGATDAFAGVLARIARFVVARTGLKDENPERKFADVASSGHVISSLIHESSIPPESACGAYLANAVAQKLWLAPSTRRFSATKKEAFERNLVATDPWAKGFSVVLLLNSENQLGNTSIRALSSGPFPEIALRHILSSARSTIMISATAAFGSVISSFDLEKVQQGFEGNLKRLDGEDLVRAREQVADVWRNEGLWKVVHDEIRVGFVEPDGNWTFWGATGRCALDELLHDKTLRAAAMETLKASPAAPVSVREKEDWLFLRYARLAAAWREFIVSNGNVCLALCAALPSNRGGGVEIERLRRLFELVFIDVLADKGLLVGRSPADVEEEARREVEDAVVIIRGTSDFYKNWTKNVVEPMAQNTATTKFRRFCITSHGSAGVGLNPVLARFPGDHGVRAGILPENGMIDVDFVYLEKPTNIFPAFRGDETAEESSEKELRTLYYLERLYLHGEITKGERDVAIKILEDSLVRNTAGGKQPGRGSLASKFSHTPSYKLAVAKIVAQSSGRACRAPTKPTVIRILTTPQIVDKVCARKLLQEASIVHSPIVRAIFETCAGDLNVSIEDELVSELERRNRIVNQEFHARHHAILRKIASPGHVGRITVDDMDFWFELRALVGKMPFSDKSPQQLRTEGKTLEADFVDTYMIELKHPARSYRYRKESDFNATDGTQVCLDSEGLTDREVWPCVASEQDCRLETLCQIPGLEKEMLDHGWKTRWTRAKYVICPELYESVYKAVLGEFAGVYIIEQLIADGLSCKPVLKSEMFELFDAELWLDGELAALVDFKHWRLSTDRKDLREKAASKMALCGVRDAFYLNILPPAEYCSILPPIEVRLDDGSIGRIHTFPNLVQEDGALDKVAAAELASRARFALASSRLLAVEQNHVEKGEDDGRMHNECH